MKKEMFALVIVGIFIVLIIGVQAADDGANPGKDANGCDHKICYKSEKLPNGQCKYTLIEDAGIDAGYCDDTYRYGYGLPGKIKRCYNGECKNPTCEKAEDCPDIQSEKEFKKCDNSIINGQQKQILETYKPKKDCGYKECNIAFPTISEENCKPPTAQCSVDKCVEGECNINYPCEGNKVCEDFKCVEKTCTGNEDCEKYNSVSGYCNVNGLKNPIGVTINYPPESKNIVQGLEISNTFKCDNGKCIKISSQKEEICQTKKCIDGKCVECFKDYECENNKVCSSYLGGECRKQKCDFDEECPDADTKEMCGDDEKSILQFLWMFKCEKDSSGEKVCVRKDSISTIIDCQDSNQFCMGWSCVDCYKDEHCKSDEYCDTEDFANTCKKKPTETCSTDCEECKPGFFASFLSFFGFDEKSDCCCPTEAKKRCFDDKSDCNDGFEEYGDSTNCFFCNKEKGKCEMKEPLSSCSFNENEKGKCAPNGQCVKCISSLDCPQDSGSQVCDNGECKKDVKCDVNNGDDDCVIFNDIKDECLGVPPKTASRQSIISKCVKGKCETTYSKTEEECEFSCDNGKCLDENGKPICKKNCLYQIKCGDDKLQYVLKPCDCEFKILSCENPIQDGSILLDDEEKNLNIAVTETAASTCKVETINKDGSKSNFDLKPPELLDLTGVNPIKLDVSCCKSDSCDTSDTSVNKCKKSLAVCEKEPVLHPIPDDKKVSIGGLGVCDEESIEATPDEIIKRLFSEDPELKSAMLNLLDAIDKGEIITNENMKILVNKGILTVYEKEFKYKYNCGNKGLLGKLFDIKKIEKARILSIKDSYFIFKENIETKCAFLKGGTPIGGPIKISKGWELYAITPKTFSLDWAVADTKKILSKAEQSKAMLEFILYVIPYGKAADLGFSEGRWGAAAGVVAIDTVFLASGLGSGGEAVSFIAKTENIAGKVCTASSALYMTGDTGKAALNTLGITEGRPLGTVDVMHAILLGHGVIKLSKGNAWGATKDLPRKIPLGLSEKEFIDMKKRITRELDSMPLDYKPSQVRVVGSSVSGYSSEYSSDPGRLFKRDIYHDYDISIIVERESYDSLANSIRNRLYPGSAELRTFEKELAKGKISKFWLNKVSSDKKFTERLYTYANELGVGKVQVSVILEKSNFDTGLYLPFNIINTLLSFFIK